MTVDISKLAFYSPTNYMKRHPSSSSSPLAAGKTLQVTHDLGYIPFYEVYMTTSDGILWNNTKITSSTGSSEGGSGDDPNVEYWTTTDLLEIQSFDTVETQVYCLIYWDYGENQ